jgi:cytidylate kinase
VDTGALYRTVALIAQRRGQSLTDEAAVAGTARDLGTARAIALSTQGQDITVRAFGEDVTSAIRTREASLGASRVSQIPEVREALLDIQRQLGSEGGVVLEGRDIGSVVFPEAKAKFYLTASAEVRAARRRAELTEAGEAPSLEAIVAEVNERDRRDTERPIAPLMQAEDAIVVDSSEMSLEDVVETIVSHVRALEGE